MKKLLVLLMCFMFSCSPQDVEVKENTSIPYYEIQSKVDTVKYNMVEINSTYYLLVDGIVKKRIFDYKEDASVNFFIGLCVGIFLLLLLDLFF